MENRLPKFHETFNQILEVLKNGETIPSRELVNKVKENYYSKLPKELLEEKTKSGDNLLSNRINWGKSYLKKGGYILYPVRGSVQITDIGKNSVTEKLTLSDVQSRNGINEFYKIESDKLKKPKNIEIENSSPQDLIETGIIDIESQVKSDLLERLKGTDPYYFEKVVLILLQKMGYGDFVETKKSNDGGIDGVINEDKLGLERIYIQAKRYDSNKVREKDIRNFIGAMSGDTMKGVFVTTSEFDKGAVKKSNEAHHTIILIDGKKLVDLMHEYSVGVQIKETYEVKELDEEFFI